ncbi:MAG: PspC domain-containing protein [Pseudomonadales bacterium]|jgi:phage shock protein C|nr:PspC domain-containing protein [Pseudomonadales bacterium]MDA0954841.1 PspC domain-containing protein [Pseudomonadota bacterium]
MAYSYRDRTACEHRGFYRNPYHGWVAGVCAGFAERMGISPIWLRLLALFGLFTATTLTVLAYLAAWVLLDRRCSC